MSTVIPIRPDVVLSETAADELHALRGEVCSLRLALDVVRMDLEQDEPRSSILAYLRQVVGDP